MRPIPRRVAGRRLDHLLILLGAAVMAVGSVLPWVSGSTRMHGNIHWTGLDDTGEGAMLLAAGLVLALWVRWRGVVESELTPRARFVPIVVAVVCGLLWVIAFRKVLVLSWFDLAVGARPQVGMAIALAGILLMAAGGLLAATDPASVAAQRAAEERARLQRERRRSGAGGDGAASDGLRRGGGGRPPEPDEYSVVARIERVSGRTGGEDDAGRDRG